MHLPARPLVLAILLQPSLFAASCDNQEGAKPGPTGAADKSAKGQLRPIPADHSLSADEYIKLGMPAYDREWVGSDMAKALAVLTALADKSPEQLPRFESPRSGPVFARLTDVRNFEFFRNRTLSLIARSNELVSFGEAYNAIQKRYWEAFQLNAVGPRDMIELACGSLRQVMLQCEWIDEVRPTLSIFETSYRTRLEALEQMKRGQALTVSGALTTVTERDSYPTKDRVAFIQVLKQTLPVILPHLPEGSRLEMVRRIKELSEDATFSDLRPAITELAEVTK